MPKLSFQKCYTFSAQKITFMVQFEPNLIQNDDYYKKNYLFKFDQYNQSSV